MCAGRVEGAYLSALGARRLRGVATGVVVGRLGGCLGCGLGGGVARARLWGRLRCAGLSSRLSSSSRATVPLQVAMAWRTFV